MSSMHSYRVSLTWDAVVSATNQPLHFYLIFLTADMLHRLISLEAEYQPLPGHEAAVTDVIGYLNKVRGSWTWTVSIVTN